MTFEKHNSHRFIYLVNNDSDDLEFFADSVLQIDRDNILRKVPNGMLLMDNLSVLSDSDLPAV